MLRAVSCERQKMVKKAKALCFSVGLMGVMIVVYYAIVSSRRTVVVDRGYNIVFPQQEDLAASNDPTSTPSQVTPPHSAAISNALKTVASSAHSSTTSIPPHVTTGTTSTPPHTTASTPPHVTKGTTSTTVSTAATSSTPLYDHQMVSAANLDVWVNLPGYLVDDLRSRSAFPASPDIRKTTENLKVTFNEKDRNGIKGNYGHKMYGYLLPRTEGEHKLRVSLPGTTAACSVELWLSSGSSPFNISCLASLEYSELHRDPKGADLSAQSKQIRLRKGVYYFEFLMKAHDGKCNAEIQWEEPQQTTYSAIPSECFAMAVKLKGRVYADGWAVSSTLLKGPLPSNQLQSHKRVQYVADTLYPITDLDVLPKCNFSAAYVRERKIKQYSGVYTVIQSKVFPADQTFHMRWYKKDMGNKIVDAPMADKVLHLYKKAFKEIGHEDNVNIRMMEETLNKELGSRFLLELDIFKDKEATVHTSEYVYLPAKSGQLCHTSNFQWRKNVDVYLVVSVKNLGLWVRHLIHNIEHIYRVTGDTHLELVIVDYGSKDIDMEKELQSSSLPRWKVIKMSGGFSRSGGLQAGIDYVTNPNSIVMTLDMHLTLPPGFVEYSRRHAVQGKMGFAPMFFRLNHGFTEININGFWETLTYGLLGLYKSDWTRTGGFDTEKYTTKWGGEDWDAVDKVVAKGIELFRVRYPGVMHYYHTKVGLWDTTKKI